MRLHQLHVKEHARKPPKTPKRCPGGQPAPRSGSEAARVREDIIVRTRHLFCEKKPVALAAKTASRFSLDANTGPGRLVLWAYVYDPSGSRAEIYGIGRLFSTPSSPILKLAHRSIGDQLTALRNCLSLVRWRILSNVCPETVGTG